MGGRGFRPGGAGGLGIGGVILLLVVSYFLGVDPSQLLNDSGVSTGGEPPASTPAGPPGSDPAGEFAKKILADTEDTWTTLFERSGQQYSKPVLVLFSDAVDSACGQAGSATGPFYCPGDQRVYLDLSFFRELDRRFGAPGDFAQAYVIAHELGHHVQHLQGIDSRVRQLQRSNPDATNPLSVRLELQADCYAGVWAHSAAERGKLETGDIDEGLGAASAVGDDRIQQKTTGSINVDAFTHGSAQQRAQWFRRGFESGSSNSCDTFASQ
jgi:predicted metalloprotease